MAAAAAVAIDTVGSVSRSAGSGIAQTVHIEGGVAGNPGIAQTGPEESRLRLVVAGTGAIGHHQIPERLRCVRLHDGGTGECEVKDQLGRPATAV